MTIWPVRWSLGLLAQLKATHSDGALGDFFSSYAAMLPQIATASKGLCSACISARADGLMPAQKSFLAKAMPEASKIIKRLPVVCYRVIDGSERSEEHTS